MVRSHRRGFSLVEVLIVMAVILTLMGIGVLAFQHIEKVAGEKSTITRLEMLTSMLNEYDALGGVVEGPTAVYNKGATVPNPGSVAEGAGNRDAYVTPTPPPPAISGPAAVVQYTGLVLKMFAQMPNVKVMIGQIPGEAMLTKVGAAGTGVQTEPFWDDTVPLNQRIALPVLLDGWKNPIIYVPSGGLTGVWIGGPRPQPGLITTNAVQHTVVSVDGRPFWASAGPDGNFEQGDDNLYSCPVLYK